MNYYYDTFEIPLGDFSAALDANGTVIATAFGDVDRLRQCFKSPPLSRNADIASAVRNEIIEFFHEERRAFTVPLAPAGTPFQQRVWAALLRIPFGETRSYRDIAAEVGNPAACRAVGGANGRNPICLIIPCHRVIGANGSLAGFGFGPEIKRRLLEHEGHSFPAWELFARDEMAV
jgi:methylated-DNA-[protein]-cysteine S-methyltransferase